LSPVTIEKQRRLAATLPDIPRWVETRDFLLEGTGEVFGLREEPDLSFVALDTESGFIGIVGLPQADAIAEAAARSGRRDEAICEMRARNHVSAAIPGWTSEEAILYRRDESHPLPAVLSGAVHLLTSDDVASLAAVPQDLRLELQQAVEWSPLAATIVDEQPVSFCYAGAETETLWDISIDTLEVHRGNGYAGLCVSYMIALMRTHGKEPMWGAMESNAASRRVAAKLGFKEVDRIVVFSPPK
jgi:hypothetical protein